MGNCGSMFCGAGHYRKQERIIKKFIKDPNTQVNQEGSNFNSSGRLLSAQGAQSNPANVSESYAKRQMFYYGVDEH